MAQDPNPYRQMIQRLDDMVKSRFIEMFGDIVSGTSKYPLSTIGSVCSSVVRGPFGSSLKKEFFVPPSLDTVKVYEQKHAIQKDWTLGTYFITAEKAKELCRFECHAGDFIMSCSGTMGELYQLPEGSEPGVINQALCKFTLSEQILPIYFQMAMSMLIHNLSSHGSAIANIAAVKYVKEMKIPLPPLAEQRNFVVFANQVDKSKSIAMQAAEKYDQLVKSRFIEMFGQKEPKESFNNCVDTMLKGPFGSDIKKDLFVPKSADTYKVYIQVNAIQKDQNLGEYYISKDYYYHKMYRFKVDPGDYLITCDGTMGKWIRLDDDIEPGIISASLLKIKIDESVLNPRFFESLWEYNMLPSLLSQVRNGCLKHLPSAKVIGNEKIILPSMEEQMQFAMFKEQID